MIYLGCQHALKWLWCGMMVWYPPLNVSSALTWHMFMHVVESKLTLPLWYLCSWCSYPTHASTQCWLCIIYVHDHIRSPAGCFPILLLVFTCTKRECCLYIKIFKPELFQMSPPYLPICGITLPFQVNLHVPPLNYSNEHLFCVPGPLMERQGAVSIFHAKWVILRWVFIHL